MLVPPEAYILTGVIALAAVGPLAFGAVRRSVLSPVVWVALTYVVAFVVRPLYILSAPDRAHAYIRDSGHFPELVVAGLCLAAAGIAVFWLGYLARAGERLSSLVPRLPQELSPSRWRVAILVLLVIGLVGYWFLLRQAGGLSALVAMLHMRAAFYEGDELAGGLKAVTRLVGLAAIMGVYHHLTMRRTWWTWPLAIVASVIVGTTGGRGAVVMGIWLVLYFLYALYRERYRSWRFLVVLLLSLAFVATAALAARRATAEGLGAVPRALLRFPSQFTEAAMEEARFFDCMVAAMQATGHEIVPQQGATYELIVLLMVPRALRPYQPVSAGMMLREVIEPMGLGGRPSAAIGEGYMNFGVSGALVAMFLLGVWCRLLQAYAVRTNGRSQMAPLLFVNALASVPHFLLGVAPLAIRGLVIDLVVLAVAFVWAARMREVPAAAPSLGNGETDAVS